MRGAVKGSDTAGAAAGMLKTFVADLALRCNKRMMLYAQAIVSSP